MQECLGEAVEAVIPADDESAYLALGLLGEMGKGEEGPFWPYLSILPTVEDMDGVPLLWNDDDRARLLAGSHLDACVGGAREGLLAQWAAVEARCRERARKEGRYADIGWVRAQHDRIFPRDLCESDGHEWLRLGEGEIDTTHHHKFAPELVPGDERFLFDNSNIEPKLALHDVIPEPRAEPLREPSAEGAPTPPH